MTHFAFSLKQEKELGRGVRQAALGLGIIPGKVLEPRFVKNGPGKDCCYLGCCEAGSDDVQRAESPCSPLPAPPQALRAEAEGQTGYCRVSKATARAQRMGGMWAGEGDQGELMARRSALFLFPEAPIAADVISVYPLDGAGHPSHRRVPS